MKELILRQDIEEIIGGVSNVIQGLKGKTILLSGGCGFLGRYFSTILTAMNQTLLDPPCKLIAIDNFITADSCARLDDGTENYRLIEHNIIEPLVLDEKIDFVIHAAGIASPFYYRAYPLETLDVAVRGTRNLLEVAKTNQARFLFFSSSEIYGDPDMSHVPIPESYRGNVSCQGPRACYDEGKRVGETLCYIYHGKFGVASNVVRPFNVFGPGMKENDYRVLPNFANRIKRLKPLKIYGHGNQTRTFCYITDAINGFLRVALKGVPGEAYNIGNPEPEISMLDLAQLSSKAVGRDVGYDLIEYPDSYPADEPIRRCPDIRKARLQLGYEPRVSLLDGLQRFYEWALENYAGIQI